MQSFCKANDNVNKTKQWPTEWEKIFTNTTSDRDLISKIYKELKKQDINKPNKPFLKMGERPKLKILNKRISNYWETPKDMLHILSCKEVQVKLTLKFHLTLVRIAKITNRNDYLCWGSCGQGEHPFITDRSANLYSHFGNQFVSFSEN